MARLTFQPLSDCRATCLPSTSSRGGGCSVHREAVVRKKIITLADLVEGQGTRGYRPRGYAVRFWEKVSVLGDTDCWPWIGDLNKLGYGRFELLQRKFLAHRFSYLIANGYLDETLCVLHSCDNPRCVNPRHLRQGSRADNQMDAWIKGRIRRGQEAGAAKLTADNVAVIRARLAKGESHRSIAKDYGVSRSNIGAIKNGISWRAWPIIPKGPTVAFKCPETRFDAPEAPLGALNCPRALKRLLKIL